MRTSTRPDTPRHRLKNTIYSKKYGCDLARFTHRKPNIVYASTKENHDLRYMSSHDNKYLRYFKGHEALVTGLAVAPTDDTLLSCSVDGSVRLWDLGSPHCVAMLNTGMGTSTGHGPPTVAFDHSGIVFGVASHTSIRLYDMKAYEQGPFSIFQLETDDLFYPPFAPSGGGRSATSLRALHFSNDGKYILAANSLALYLVDSFQGNITARLMLPGGQEGAGRSAPSDRVPACGFTPDAKFVYSGMWGEGGD
jgi:COMPASS component SWD2